MKRLFKLISRNEGSVPCSLFPVPSPLSRNEGSVPCSPFPVPSHSGFTLVELLVVMAMIAIIVAAFVTSVEKARRRAYVSRATVEIKEMTNAILAYEQYAPGRTLASVASGSWKDCAEGAMTMILGGATSANGGTVPVLYNGHVRTGYLRDPWNTPYRFRIEKTDTLQGGGGEETKTISYGVAAALPNFFRLTDAERR